MDSRVTFAVGTDGWHEFFPTAADATLKAILAQIRKEAFPRIQTGRADGTKGDEARVPFHPVRSGPREEPPRAEFNSMSLLPSN